MPQQSREHRAVERAEKYAPMPTGGSFMAGICGAALALMADIAFSAFYGWRVRDHALITVFLLLAGFLGGFIVHRRLAALSRKARRAELKQIHLDEDGPSA